MPPPETVELGARTRAVVANAAWATTSEFPASQAWADDVESVLAFLEANGVLNQFLPRLLNRETERDGALAEARSAFFFSQNGFEILSWAPSATSKPGDFEMEWHNTGPVFVEVKGPGWEGELTEEERNAGRQHRSKYINGEARWIDPMERVEYAIKKALPKFANDRANMLVVQDDLFVSPTETPEDILEGKLRATLRAPNHGTIGGVLLLAAASKGARVEYERYFVANEFANNLLPGAVIEALRTANTAGAVS